MVLEVGLGDGCHVGDEHAFAEPSGRVNDIANVSEHEPPPFDP